MRSYMLLSFFLAISLTTYSQDSLFFANKYEKAVEGWYEHAGSNGDTPGNSFNIAIAEWKAGHIPEAVMAMEKARRMAPLNSKIDQKWRQLRRDIESPVPVSQDFFLITWFKGFVLLLRPGMWMVMACVLILTSIWIYIRNSGRNRRFTPFIYICLAGAVVGISLSLASYKILFRDDEAVVWNRTELRIAASPQSPSRKSVSAGEKVKIKDKIGSWYHVSLLNHDEGWIEESDLRKIVIIPRT